MTAVYEVYCPRCGGLMKMMEIINHKSRKSILHFPSFDWWCPACKVRWADVKTKPMEGQ